MGGLSAFAAELREIATRAEASLAVDCARAMADAALDQLRIVTPVRSGALRGSEHIDAVFGGGSYAGAVLAPHIIYAKFRNDGGTISAKEGLGRKGMRPHTLHWEGGGFPLHVTQAGAHYIEKGEAAARGPCSTAAARVAAFYFTL